MAKEKKPLTATQKKNRYRTLQYVYRGGEYLAILSPYIIMGGIYFDEWFRNNEDSWKIGLGGALALAILGIAVFLISKKKEDTKVTDGYISLILGWFAVSFIFMLLATIMDQIATIMFFGGLGLMTGFGLDMLSKSYKTKADLYVEAIKKVQGENREEEVRQQIENEVKEEQKKKDKIAVD